MLYVGTWGIVTPWVGIIVQLGLMEPGAGRPLEIKTAYSIFLFQGLQGFGIFSALYICSVFLSSSWLSRFQLVYGV